MWWWYRHIAQTLVLWCEIELTSYRLAELVAQVWGYDYAYVCFVPVIELERTTAAGAAQADVKLSPTGSLSPESLSEGVCLFVRTIHNVQSI